MLYITLTPEQARAVANAPGPVEIRDPDGKVLACIPAPSDAEMIERAKRSRASGKPCSPSATVFARMERIAQAVQQDELDLVGVQALLDRLRAEDQG
jgi:hypothetical protein